MKEIDFVQRFLIQQGISGIEEKMSKLELYVELLWEVNKTVNLISRKTLKGEIWLNHVLDSLLPIGKLSFDRKTVLDFGSGGGLPGIPLKIIFPDSYIYLLDSRQRKMEAVKKIVKKLDLTDCLAICSRLEELDGSWNRYFDRIVCRSVKMKSLFWAHVYRLLKQEGKVFFYKGKAYSDLDNLRFKSYDISMKEIGTRTLIEMKKENVPRGT